MVRKGETQFFIVVHPEHCLPLETLVSRICYPKMKEVFSLDVRQNRNIKLKQETRGKANFTPF